MKVHVTNIEHIAWAKRLIISFYVTHAPHNPSVGNWLYLFNRCGYRNVCDEEWIVMDPNWQHPLHSDNITAPGHNKFVWDYGGVQGLNPQDFDSEHSYVVQISLMDPTCDWVDPCLDVGYLTPSTSPTPHVQPTGALGTTGNCGTGYSLLEDDLGCLFCDPDPVVEDPDIPTTGGDWRRPWTPPGPGPGGPPPGGGPPGRPPQRPKVPPFQGPGPGQPPYGGPTTPVPGGGPTPGRPPREPDRPGTVDPGPSTDRPVVDGGGVVPPNPGGPPPTDPTDDGPTTPGSDPTGPTVDGGGVSIISGYSGGNQDDPNRPGTVTEKPRPEHDGTALIGTNKGGRGPGFQNRVNPAGEAPAAQVDITLTEYTANANSNPATPNLAMDVAPCDPPRRPKGPITPRPPRRPRGPVTQGGNSDAPTVGDNDITDVGRPGGVDDAINVGDSDDVTVGGVDNIDIVNPGTTRPDDTTIGGGVRRPPTLDDFDRPKKDGPVDPNGIVDIIPGDDRRPDGNNNTVPGGNRPRGNFGDPLVHGGANGIDNINSPLPGDDTNISNGDGSSSVSPDDITVADDLSLSLITNVLPDGSIFFDSRVDIIPRAPKKIRLAVKAIQRGKTTLLGVTNLAVSDQPRILSRTRRVEGIDPNEDIRITAVVDNGDSEILINTDVLTPLDPGTYNDGGSTVTPGDPSQGGGVDSVVRPNSSIRCPVRGDRSVNVIVETDGPVEKDIRFAVYSKTDRFSVSHNIRVYNLDTATQTNITDDHIGFSENSLLENRGRLEVRGLNIQDNSHAGGLVGTIETGAINSLTGTNTGQFILNISNAGDTSDNRTEVFVGEGLKIRDYDMSAGGFSGTGGSYNLTFTTPHPYTRFYVYEAGGNKVAPPSPDRYEFVTDSQGEGSVDLPLSSIPAWIGVATDGPYTLVERTARWFLAEDR